jgi:molybdopterin synthase catalytic subunit
MEVAHSKGDARPGAASAAAAAAASRRHDTFPRWFRMAAKLVRCLGLVVMAF